MGTHQIDSTMSYKLTFEIEVFPNNKPTMHHSAILVLPPLHRPAAAIPAAETHSSAPTTHTVVTDFPMPQGNEPSKLTVIHEADGTVKPCPQSFAAFHAYIINRFPWLTRDYGRMSAMDRLAILANYLIRTLDGKDQATRAGFETPDEIKAKAGSPLPPPDIASEKEVSSRATARLAATRRANGYAAQAYHIATGAAAEAKRTPHRLSWRYGTGGTLVGYLPGEENITLFTVDKTTGGDPASKFRYALHGVPLPDGPPLHYEEIIDAQDAAELALADWFKRHATSFTLEAVHFDN